MSLNIIENCTASPCAGYLFSICLTNYDTIIQLLVKTQGKNMKLGLGILIMKVDRKSYFKKILISKSWPTSCQIQVGY